MEMKKRFISTMLVIALLLTSISLLPASAASDEVIGGVFRLKNLNSLLCLEANDTDLQQAKYTGSLNQNWRISSTGDGNYIIIPEHDTSLCLGYTLIRKVESVSLFEYTSPTNAQKWKVVRDASTNAVKLYPVSQPEKIVAVEDDSILENAYVDLVTDKVNASGKWLLEAVAPKNTLTDGTYRVKTKDKTFVIDNGVSSFYQSDLRLMAKSESLTQQWTFTYGNDGYYTIQTQVGAMTYIPSTGKIRTANYTGASEQRWMVTKNIDGTYRISPKVNLHKCLTVENNSLTALAYITIAEDYGSTTGSWHIVDSFEPILENNSYYMYTNYTNYSGSSYWMTYDSSTPSAGEDLVLRSQAKYLNWEVTRAETGQDVYYIKLENSNLAITSGGKLQPFTGSDLQKWRIAKSSNSIYYEVRTYLSNAPLMFNTAEGRTPYEGIKLGTFGHVAEGYVWYFYKLYY